MPQEFDRLRAGDISKTSPADTKAQELSKRMVLSAVELKIPATDALGAACGFVTWIASHFTEPDRSAVVEAFITSVKMSCQGEGGFSTPLKNVVTFPDNPFFPKK